MDSYIHYQVVIYAVSFVLQTVATAIGVYLGMKWFNKSKKDK